ALQSHDRAANDCGYSAYGRTGDATTAKNACQYGDTSDQVGKDAAQSSTVTRRQGRHHGCSHHRLRLRFVLFVGGRSSNHFGKSFVVGHFVMSDFVSNFLGSFMMRFALPLELVRMLGMVLPLIFVCMLEMLELVVELFLA